MCRKENFEPSFTEDFKEAASDPYYVDKTLFLKEFINRDIFCCSATLITRPRGFGKTLMLSMVKTFFEKTEEDASVYFKDLAIWDCGEKYTSEQGKYPVVYVDLTDLSCDTFEEMKEKFAEKMSAEFLRHTELSEEGAMKEFWLRDYNEVIEKKSRYLEESVELLTRLLFYRDKVKPIILVDGFEVPLLAGLKHGYYKEASGFFRHMYSSSMKGNEFSKTGLIFGEYYTVLADDYSGFNNVIVHTLLSTDYTSDFGFTEEEVRGLLKKFGKEEKFSEVKRWYGGYHMEKRRGELVELFNPDSVIRYLKNGCRAKAYRDEFYGCEALDGFLVSGDDFDKEYLYKVMEGQSIFCCVHESCCLDRIDERYVQYFQFLYMSGYLTFIKETKREFNDAYHVKMPNREIREIFSKHADIYGHRDEVPQNKRRAKCSDGTRKSSSQRKGASYNRD